MVAWKTEADTLPLHTVLIVSDQLHLVAVWETLFSERNCIVLSESTVPNALQSARLVAPSLMLVDMQLSKTERADLIHGLREASRGPILLLIAAETAQEVVEANQAGADECLIKPVNPAVLVVKSMAWLGHGKKTRHTAPLFISNVQA
jgi:DNA-binding response OmpR family regulator